MPPCRAAPSRCPASAALPDRRRTACMSLPGRCRRRCSRPWIDSAPKPEHWLERGFPPAALSGMLTTLSHNDPIRGKPMVNATGGAGPQSSAAPSSGPSYMPALVVLTSLFFMWGLITSLNDILIPHLKAIFTLSYVQAMLIQFCFFGAYFVASIPAGYLVEKIGYRRGIIIGLVTAGIGCIGFYPAASAQSYPLFLAALFVLASGITLLQVAANPYVSVLGPSDTAASRLNLTQAFNSLGTTVGPFLGSMFILTAAVSAGAAVDTAEEIQTVQGPHLVLAGLLFLIAIIFSQFKLPVVKGTDATTATADEHNVPSVWKHSHLVLGAVAIFMYVGAEVAI